MIETLWITNPNGDTLELDLRSSDTDHGLLIFNMTGLGPPKATVSGTAGPGYDGIRGSFVRADARHMVLTLAVTATGADEEIAKQLIYDFFPVKETVVIGITTGAKDVYGEAIVETNEMAEFAHTENAVIGLYFSDPYFLDLIETLFYVPYNVSTNVHYKGETPTGIEMTVILGSYFSGNVVITNNRGSQSMTIDLSVFGGDPGDRIYINTMINQKSIILTHGMDGTPIDMLTYVGFGEDWIQLHPGDNSIKITVGGTPSLPADLPDPANLKVYVPFNELYGGDAEELQGGDTFINSDSIVEPTPGAVYDNARLFDFDDEPYLKNAAPNADLCPVGDFTVIWMAKVTEYVAGYNITVIDTNYHGSSGDGWGVSGANGGYFYMKMQNNQSYKTKVINGAVTGVWNTS